MKSRVLISGIGGFISAHLMQHIFETTNWEITGIESWRHKGTPERVRQVLAKNPEWRKRIVIMTHDISVLFPERTKKLIGRCDYIINVAADSHVDRSIDDPVPFIENNVGIALTMLEFAREYPCKAFIQISTDEVYGAAPDGVKHKEWSPIVPSNPYAASKAAQEAVAISYWRTYGIPVIITNTMNNFGEMQDSEKFVAKCIRLIKEDKSVPLHGKVSGTTVEFGSRFYLHARNHADAVLFILNNLPPKLYKDGNMLPDRYNVVGDREISNYEMADIIAKIMGKKLRYQVVDHHATRPGHDRRYALDGDKLASLNWKAPTEFKASLEKYVHWTLEHPIWL